MLIEVRVPVLPESVAEATLVNWHKKTGDAVRRDENLIDIETDKGVLKEIKKPDGSTVTAQEVIAVIDTEAKGAAASTSAPSASAAQPSPPPAAPPKAAAPTTARQTAPSDGGGAGALPAARKILSEAGIGAGEVEGTGRGGRVTKGDALAAVGARAEPQKGAPPPTA